MTQLGSPIVRSAQRNLGVVAALFCVLTVAHGEANAVADDAPVGRIDFETADLPAANVEVDLSQAMFKDLIGIGDAAIAGAAEAVLNATHNGEGAHKQVHLAAEQLEAARQIMQIFGNVVREVRVRAYESLPEGTDDATSLFKPFEGQLKSAKWETIVRVRQDEQVARVSVLRSGGAIRGIFVTASDGDAVVLANVVCELSPENVKKLSAAATKIGLEANFQPKFELKMSQSPEDSDTRSAVSVRTKAPGKLAKPPAPPIPPAPPAAIEK